MHEDTKRYVASCPEYQRIGNISQRNSMPLRYNLQIDLFDVWGIDFMGHFKNSHGFEHICSRKISTPRQVHSKLNEAGLKHVPGPKVCQSIFLKLTKDENS
jgi:hypothetical protein